MPPQERMRKSLPVHLNTRMGGIATLFGVLVSQGSWESWSPAMPTGTAESPPMAASPSPSRSSQVGDEPAQKVNVNANGAQQAGMMDVVRRLQEMAESGDTWAMKELADAYISGRRGQYKLAPDETLAFRWYERCAGNEHLDCVCLCGPRTCTRVV